MLERAAAGGRDGRAGATADEEEEEEVAADNVSIGGSGWPMVEAEDIVELRSRRTLSAALGAAVSVEATSVR